MDTEKTTSSILLNYELLDEYKHLSLIKLTTNFSDNGKQLFAIVNNLSGEIYYIAITCEALHATWKELTGISYNAYGLPNTLAKKIKQQLREGLQKEGVKESSLNHRVSFIFEFVAGYLKPYIDFIGKLGDLYVEHRSDVSEMCGMFLESGAMPDVDMRESRFVYGTLPDGTELMYDTLTTHIEYMPVGGVWDILNTDYKG
ncbi:hypothetical protein [Sphaerochaeta globosa]|uniref:Uncharacterized protein n=1 Tax=Sphaerochaeta globosa (strain ATCC BAA-1886 / DSM 22777 / Buddy) TaxID=158189 RepID=F0RTH8_SPHGB|nr:hypothetical protein [Sphaerochaeta globosa]ADY14173.1 hypothetical protein SpiBuddy_2358 [Sphaerochaeta globosa str. Buddy]